MNLQSLILDSLDEDSLFLLNKRYSFFPTDIEIRRRLESDYLPVLDFLFNNEIEKTYHIKEGLKNLRNMFPWRIGVVYDFRTGRVENIEIRIGTNFGRYSLKGSKILFTWLDSFENKKMLREIVSYNSKNSLFSRKLDEEKSDKIRDMILNNKRLTVDITIENKSVQSFPGNPLRENYLVYPSCISQSNETNETNESNETVKLVDIESIANVEEKKTIRFTNVKIKFSPDVIKYFHVISRN